MAKRSSRRQLSFSGGDDDLCKLCQCHNSHLSSPASWRNEQARSHVLSLQVPPDSLVCRPCRHDVTRVLANPCYVPRWRKGKTSAKNSTCCILGCSSVTLSAVGSTSEVHHAFESMGLKCSSEVIPTPTPLCKYHYHLTYNALQPRECATCGTRLRGNNHRPCPKPDVIQEHLRERTGFEGEIHSQDRVCITCYKSHLVVLKADPQCVSRDNDLKQLVSTYTKQMPAIQRGATSSGVIKAAMARTVVHVGNILLQNQAILLPTIHSVFTSYITDLLKGTDIGIEDIGHISSRWVLSDLTTSLQHHITYSCKIRKYGTLVYRLGADLTPSLSEALWRLRSTETSTNEPKAPDGPATCSRDLDHINKLVHKQIANFLAQDAHSPFEHDEVNFDDLITQIDPELWSIVCTLTKSKSENRGTSKVTDPLSPAYHVKRIRRLFLICTILFCTDDRCSMPLHTLLTDTVESQGGSALLVQILNRLGVCASSDTLSRFIQYQVSNDKPDVKALFFHWKRSCWIMHMWSQGDRNTMYLQPLTEHGWSVSEGTLSVVWDTQRNMQAIRERVSLLLRGCKCITGCSTGRCSCRRSHRECAEGCLCVNCSNITVVSRNDDSNSELAEIALEEVAVDDDENNTEELMDWIFGPEMEGSESDEDS